MTLSPDHFSVTYLPEDAYTCGLAGIVQVGQFSGAGEAWFGNSQIDEFLAALEQFSKTLSGTAHLAGGFWKNEKLDQVNLAMRFYSINTTGLIGVRIELSGPNGSDRKDSVSNVRVELQTNVQQVDQFLNEMKIMMKRKEGQARMGAY